MMIDGMITRTLLIFIFVFSIPATLSANNTENTVLILYNHGTSGDNDCAWSLFIKERFWQFPKWAKDLQGTKIKNKLGEEYQVKVEFLCTEQNPEIICKTGSTDCSLSVCRRAKQITRILNDRAQKYPRKNIFLAGHSAGAWASLLIKRNAPQSVNGLILAAPAFGGTRRQRSCEQTECNIYEASEMQSIAIRKKHDRHLAGNTNNRYKLDAMIIAFPCDKFGWPDEFPFNSENNVEQHIFPFHMKPNPSCSEITEYRYYDGERRKFCTETKKKRELTEYPACSDKRIRNCPEKYEKLCKDKSHLFHDDYKSTGRFSLLSRKLDQPHFSDWFVGEGVVQDFIIERLSNWNYGAGLQAGEKPCRFMKDIPFCDLDPEGE